MAEKDITLKPVLERFPPGDRWTPVGAEQPLLSSLTEGIEWVFQNTKERDYIIKAGEGKVYIYIENEIRLFLRSKMYNNKEVLKKNNKGKKIIKDLFYAIKKKPNKFLTKEQLQKDKYRAIADFISGMTDRFAIKLHKNIK